MNILVSSLTTIGFLHSVIIRSVVISILQIRLIFMQEMSVGLPYPLRSPSSPPFSAFQHVFFRSITESFLVSIILTLSTHILSPLFFQNGKLFQLFISTSSSLKSSQHIIFQSIPNLYSFKKFFKMENFSFSSHKKVSRFGKLFSDAKI